MSVLSIELPDLSHFGKVRPWLSLHGRQAFSEHAAAAQSMPHGPSHGRIGLFGCLATCLGGICGGPSWVWVGPSWQGPD